MAKLYNLAAMTVASTGAGTITLGSAATILGVLYLSFAAAGASDGETVAYSIGDVNASEQGTGVYSASGTTLTRTPVRSTNGNAAINMTSAAIVRISPAKEDLANLRENNTFTGKQTINPASGTLNQALVIGQTSPVGGSTVGPVLFNVVDVVDQGFTVTGSGNSFGMGQAQAIGARVQYTTASTGLRGAFAGSVKAHAGAGSCYGVCGSAYSSEAVDGLWGNIGLLVLDSGASLNTAIALEGEVAIRAGASAAYRIAVSANSQGAVAGTTLDAAFMVSCGPDAASAPFKKMFALSKNVLGSQAPLDVTADIFYADAAQTIANVFNFGNVTVTGNIASFPHMAVGGAGNAVFGAPAASLPGVGLAVTAPSSGTMLLSGLPNGATGFSGLQVTDTSTNNGLFTGVFEASNTSTRFGQTAGNWAELITFGSANLGLMLGTTTNEPVIIGTNNAAFLTISGAGVATFANPTGVRTALGAAPLPAGWTAWTPTLSSGGGSLATTGTTVTGVSGKYRIDAAAKQCWYTCTATVSVVGTASTNMIFTTPTTGDGTLCGGSSVETANSGRSGGATVLLAGDKIFCRPAEPSTTATYWANTNTVVASGWFSIP